MIAIDERPERSRAGIVRLPEPVDQVRGGGALCERDQHEGDRGPRQRRHEQCADRPGRTRRAKSRTSGTAQSVASQPWTVARRSSVSGRKRGSVPPRLASRMYESRCGEMMETRNDGRGSSCTAIAARIAISARSSACRGPALASCGRTRQREHRRAEGEAGGAPEVDAAEECCCRYQQQDERDDRPAITRRRSSPRGRCRSSSCSGSRSSASSNTCSGSDPRGSALRR